jgi:uncharacterized protein (DUF2126 family)
MSPGLALPFLRRILLPSLLLLFCSHPTCCGLSHEIRFGRTLESPLPAAPLRILLLEHSSHDAASILRELRDAGISVQPTILEQRLEFEAALSAQSFAAILAAYSLPGWTGLDALSYLR